ncbi:MAG: aldo/keto reductase [Parachlamydiaceae bacterium]|nr:aldo/keto reductase [Parachlamydiaceae bacterium]
MEFTKIPTINSKVSRIGLGTWAMGGSLWGDTDEQASIQTIHRALELGINFIDTAPGYGFGLSEEVIGKAIKQYGKRENVIIATKCGLNLQEQCNVYRDSRRQSILAEIDASLKRLQVDYIDLYQVHWPDEHTSQEETAILFRELLQQGKIRTIGVSNYSIEQIKEFSKFAPLHAIQHPFNIFEREAEPILNYCKKNNITSIGYSSLCRGLLTGTLKEDHVFEELRKNFDPKFRKPHFPQYLICVGRLQQWISDVHKKSLTALAIRWSLEKGVDISLWGARTPNELNPIAEIIEWHLTPQDFIEIDKIIAETITDPIGPQFMSPPSRKFN